MYQAFTLKYCRFKHRDLRNLPVQMRVGVLFWLDGACFFFENVGATLFFLMQNSFAKCETCSAVLNANSDISSKAFWFHFFAPLRENAEMEIEYKHLQSVHYHI
jgi:hypothetical protein